MQNYYPTRCPCGHPTWPVAAMQGVSFTEAQAIAVAELLNQRAKDGVD